MGRNYIQTHKRTNRQTDDPITRCNRWIFQVNRSRYMYKKLTVPRLGLKFFVSNKIYKMILKIYQNKLLTTPPLTPPPQKKQTHKQKIMRIIYPCDKYWWQLIFLLKSWFFKYDFAENCRPILVSNMMVFCLCLFIKLNLYFLFFAMNYSLSRYVYYCSVQILY